MKTFNKTRRGIRVGIVAGAVAAMGSVPLLAFPAHADSSSCTAQTGPSVCVGTITSPGYLGVGVAEGTAPNYPDMTQVLVACAPGDVVLRTIVSGAFNESDIPVSGLTC
jgi:hypothetical protein